MIIARRLFVTALGLLLLPASPRRSQGAEELHADRWNRTGADSLVRDDRGQRANHLGRSRRATQGARGRGDDRSHGQVRDAGNHQPPRASRQHGRSAAGCQVLYPRQRPEESGDLRVLWRDHGAEPGHRPGSHLRDPRRAARGTARRDASVHGRTRPLAEGRLRRPRRCDSRRLDAGGSERRRGAPRGEACRYRQVLDGRSSGRLSRKCRTTSPKRSSIRRTSTNCR